jgi:hypothetical protein
MMGECPKRQGEGMVGEGVGRERCCDRGRKTRSRIGSRDNSPLHGPGEQERNALA